MRDQVRWRSTGRTVIARGRVAQFGIKSSAKTGERRIVKLKHVVDDDGSPI